ncbi:MAG: Fe-S cluster assembly sulfur transfer protein SufU [Candidatus Woesearchaeota archaeon]
MSERKDSAEEIAYAEEMYKQHILDLYKNPQNYGQDPDATHVKRGFNPLCGDDITMYLKIADGTIKDAHFQGKACAICTASSSLITDAIQGKTVPEIEKLSKDHILEMLHIPISSVRLKCALLPLDTVKMAIEGREGVARTEEDA